MARSIRLMDKEFLMGMYEAIDKRLDEMRDRFREEKYEPTCDPYWEGVCDGIDNAWVAVEEIFKEAASGRV